MIEKSKNIFSFISHNVDVCNRIKGDIGDIYYDTMLFLLICLAIALGYFLITWFRSLGDMWRSGSRVVSIMVTIPLVAIALYSAVMLLSFILVLFV